MTDERTERELRMLAAWVVHRDEALAAVRDILTAESGRAFEERVRLACSVIDNAVQSHPRDVTLI